MGLTLAVSLFIFFARVIDMTLATLRILMITKGRSFLAAIIGFVEAGLYIIALSEVVRHLGNYINLLFYAAGFAVGTYVDDSKIALRLVMLMCKLFLLNSMKGCRIY